MSGKYCVTGRMLRGVGLALLPAFVLSGLAAVGSSPNASGWEVYGSGTSSGWASIGWGSRGSGWEHKRLLASNNWDRLASNSWEQGLLSAGNSWENRAQGWEFLA
jgi:hypothetical protein